VTARLAAGPPWKRFEQLVLRFAPAIVADLGMDPSGMRFEAQGGRRGAYRADHDVDVLGVAGAIEVMLECKAYNRRLERKDVYAIRGQYQSMASARGARRTALVVMCQNTIGAAAYDHLTDPDGLLFAKPTGPIHVLTVPPIFDAFALPIVEWRAAGGTRLFVADAGSSRRSTEDLRDVLVRSRRFRDRIDAGSALLSRSLSDNDRHSIQLSVSDALLHLGQPAVSHALAASVMASSAHDSRERRLQRSAIVRASAAEFQLAVQQARRTTKAPGLRQARALTRHLAVIDPQERFGAELFLAAWHGRQASGIELSREFFRRARASLDTRDGIDREYGEFLLRLRSWELSESALRLDEIEPLEAAAEGLSFAHHSALAAMILRRIRRGEDVSIWASYEDAEL
jgi:hypothetical protein